MLPKDSKRRFDHETELAVIIGKCGRHISRVLACDRVFGNSCLIDLTMRYELGPPAEERPTRVSFHTFMPVGSWIVIADMIPDPQSMSNRLWANGGLRPGVARRPYRHSRSVVYLIVHGSGVNTMENTSYHWGAGDSVAAPPWAVHSHGNSGSNEAILLPVNDIPVTRALGLYREEAA